MKKRKCKQYLQLVMLLFGVTLVLSSCQKDDDIYLQESKTQETNLNVSIFRKKQLEKNSNLMRVINKTEKVVSKNKANKTVYNSYYDFTINTSYAKVIESNGLKNYTFGVYRTEDNGLLENLVLKEQADSTFRVLLVQYNITDAEKNNLINKQIVDIENKIIFVELHDISGSLFNKVNSDQETCTVFSYDWEQGSTCSAGENHSYTEGDDCSGWGNPDFTATSGGWILSASEISCGGGGGSTSSPSSPSGGSGGSGAYVPPTTTPVLCPRCPEIEIDQEEDPCEKIAEQITNQHFIEKMEILRDSTSLKRETGFSQNTDGNFEQLIPSNNGHSLTLAFGVNSNIIGFMHTHLDNFISDNDENGDGVLDETRPIRMFSPRDIKKTLLIAYYSSLPSNSYTQIDAYGLMVSSEGEYMLKFTGDLLEIPTNVSLMNLNIKAMEKLMLKFKRKVGKTNVEKRERNFLRFIKDEININGISLYKLEIDGSINEIKLDANNDRVVIPC